MMKALAVALVAMLAACAAPAAAQAVCGKRSAIAEELRQTYNEAPAAYGLRPNANTVVELFASPDGATWTLVETNADGRACLITAGEDWETVPPKPQGTAL